MTRRLVVGLVAAVALLVPALVIPATAASGALVTGKVLDAHGTPLTDTTIGYAGMFSHKPTGADGSYSFQLPTGTYWAEIFGHVEAGSEKHFLSASAQVAVSGDLTKNFTAPALVPVHLTLRNSDGTPAAGTGIRTSSTAWQTDADGTVVRWLGGPTRPIGEAEPTTDAQGRITVLALAGSTTLIQPLRANTYLPKMAVQVPGGPSERALTLPVLHQVSGRLSGAGGYGVAGASLSLSVGGVSAESTTDNDGRYAFAVPDGTYRFEAGFTHFPAYAFDFGGLGGDITVSGATTLSATLPAAAALDVRLRHSDGTPATGASVVSTTSTTTLTSSAGTPLSLTSRYRQPQRADANGLVRVQALAGTEVAVDVDVPDQGRITGVAHIPPTRPRRRPPRSRSRRRRRRSLAWSATRPEHRSAARRSASGRWRPAPARASPPAPTGRGT